MGSTKSLTVLNHSPVRWCATHVGPSGEHARDELQSGCGLWGGFRVVSSGIAFALHIDAEVVA